MFNIQQKEIFRLAAVLYADNNYEVTSNTIHRKIIESVFLSNNNGEISIHEIIQTIHSDYGFIFDYEEVNDILKQNEQSHFLLGKNQESELTACLTIKRLTAVTSKLKNNNIDFFIDEFLNAHLELSDPIEGKSTIYRFLYQVFDNNIASFTKLIDHRKELENAINIDDSFNPAEKNIINSFLKWDNDAKNKAIFDISSYALEYCLISNNNSGNNFHLKNLKNKDFYLDTNILFRAIGINGDNRKDRTITFLQKFRDAGERLIISRFTEQEYKSTIRHYVGLIGRKQIKNIDPRVFARFRKESDFFDYYHRWRKDRSNGDLKIFEAHLLTEYESLKKRFDIKEEYTVGFNEKDEKTTEILTELSRDIFSFKNRESLYTGRFETAETDARNIYLIRSKRNGQSKNIFETKYFFISSDQGLRRWDFQNLDSTPAVLLPSQWMSILLRYINRTDDDFKSFVSFLNLPHNESNISNENLQLILIGIGEITSDIDQQSMIVEQMIGMNFKGVLDRSYSDEEIIEQAKEFTKSNLETELIAAKEQAQQLRKQLEAQNQGAEQKLQVATAGKETEQAKVSKLELENQQLRADLMKRAVRRKMFVWWIKLVPIIMLTLFIVSFYVLLFLPKFSYNYAALIAEWIDSMKENSLQRDVSKAIYILPASLFLLILWNRTLSRFKPEVIKQTRKGFQDEWTDRYNQK